MGVERVKNGWRARKYVDGKRITLRNPDRKDGRFDTKAQARKAILLYEPEAQPTSKVQGLAEQWLKTHPRPSKVSNDTNRKRLNSFCQKFGGLYPTDISPDLLRAWVRQSPSAARTAKLMLKEMGYESVFNRVKLPRSSGLAKIVPFGEPDPDEQVALIARLTSVATKAGLREFAWMIQFAAYSGLRPQEQLVLKPDDINLKRREIYVQRRLERTGEVLPGGKGGKTRTVALLPEAELAFQSTTPYSDTPYIWAKPSGCLTFDTHWKWWNTVRTEAGLPEGKAGRWYMLRHFFATYLLEKGARPWDIGQMMGHEDGSLVEKLYGHPSADRARTRVLQVAQGDTDNLYLLR